jgi:hypothetical protein
MTHIHLEALGRPAIAAVVMVVAVVAVVVRFWLRA